MLPRFTPRIWRCTDQRVRVQEPWQTTQTLGLQHWKLLWFTRHGLSGCASIPSMPRVGIHDAGTQSYTKRSNSKNLSRRNKKIQLKFCRKTHPKSFRKMDDKIIGRHIAQQPSPDDFEAMREGLFISKPEQLQQPPLLTEDAWALSELKEAIAKMKTNKSGHDVEVVVEFVQLVPQSHCASKRGRVWWTQMDECILCPGEFGKMSLDVIHHVHAASKFSCANREFACERSITVF